MSFQLMALALRAQVSEPIDRLVLIVLADYAHPDHGNAAWPSIKTLATVCCASERTVQYAIGRLARAGLLEIERQSAAVMRSRPDLATNRYTLFLERGAESAPGGVQPTTERGAESAPKPIREPITNPPSAPRREGDRYLPWAQAAREDWHTRTEGWLPYSRMKRALGDLVKEHGWPTVQEVFRKYLDEKPDIRMASPEDFARTYGIWAGTRPVEGANSNGRLR